MKFNFKLTKEELKIFKKLDSPKKIQDFLETIPANLSKSGDTLMLPRRMLRENKAHCIEGAFLAAAILWFHGHKPLLLDLKSVENDLDHVVTLFKCGKCWGAISKTNHAVLRYREPIYRDVRELAMSYFHEYFLDNGKKTMRSYSKPFDLSKPEITKMNWVTTDEDLWDLATALDESLHFKILDRKMIAGLRLADRVEIEAGKLKVWK